MRLRTILLAAVAVTSAGAAQAATIEVKDAVARITVVPEDRKDVRVEVIAPNARLPVGIRVTGDRTVLDGGLNRKIRNCRGSGERAVVDILDLGSISYADMPQVVIHTPRDVRIAAGGAIFGAIGRSASLELGNSGCGDWTVANVDGDAKISQAGSGDTRIGSSGGLKIRVAGSGDVASGDVRGALDVSIAGSGSAHVRSVDGPLSVSVAGSGDVNVDGGRASTMTVSIAGSGDVGFGGPVDRLTARIAGSGDVRVAAVKGPISKTVMGSGSVRIGD